MTETAASVTAPAVDQKMEESDEEYKPTAEEPKEEAPVVEEKVEEPEPAK